MKKVDFPLFIKKKKSFNVNLFLSSKNLTRKDYGSNQIKKTYRLDE